MPNFPEHVCEKPDQRTYEHSMWTCPTCGQQWLISSGLSSFGADAWHISPAVARDRTVVQNLREAYERECIAAAYPWWAVVAKVPARAEARALRSLERTRS